MESSGFKTFRNTHVDNSIDQVVFHDEDSFEDCADNVSRYCRELCHASGTTVPGVRHLAAQANGIIDTVASIVKTVSRTRVFVPVESFTLLRSIAPGTCNGISSAAGR